ncbi:LCP family protein [Ureibacillus manganicus]|uniref:Regulatory protein MsrR n=1 Tax=Ureibacillus manganicus DSM 26584 TaxID=1384049 RepID=A0A0A3IVM6_9BACL|nr:LCP family protein [Ureibacillus manganicus]KGR78867.1 transcriptional regulator [Ureibacillus manganicus DSM 26584]
MEENQLHETRSSRKNQKQKLKKGRIILLSLFIILLLFAVYIIFEFRAGVNIAEESKIPVQDFVADEPTNNITNYLIIGVDSRGEEKSRSDTMMVLSRNHSNNEIKLISFMRDIYAEIPGYQSYKLNTAYFLGGVQLLKDTMATMFDIPIHHYVVIDFKSFESLIDIIAPDGIEIDVEKDMSAFIDVSLTQGVHKLNGKELLGYARFRHDEAGDFGRVERQQKVIDAIKDEMLSPKNILKLPRLVGALQGYIATDLTTSEEINTVLSVAMKGTVEIEKMTIPVEGTFSYRDYSHAGSVIVIDKEINKQHLHEFINLDSK